MARAAEAGHTSHIAFCCRITHLSDCHMHERIITANALVCPNWFGYRCLDPRNVDKTMVSCRGPCSQIWDNRLRHSIATSASGRRDLGGLFSLHDHHPPLLRSSGLLITDHLLRGLALVFLRRHIAP